VDFLKHQAALDCGALASSGYRAAAQVVEMGTDARRTALQASARTWRAALAGGREGGATSSQL